MMIEKMTGKFQQAKNSRLWVPEIEKIFHQHFLSLPWEQTGVEQNRVWVILYS